MEKKVLFLLKELQPDYAFEADVHFVEEGYLDSFDVITLIAGLEEEFSVNISARDIIPANFSSLKNICALVRRSQVRS